MYPIIKLKAGKEANVGFHHPWVYSGAIEHKPEGLNHGDLVHVSDRQDKIIGTGTYSATSSIAVRVFAFEQMAIDAGWIQQHIAEADERRPLMGYGPQTTTTGYRVVFGEADGLPGLVIDRYADVFVIQISTAGMDRLRGHVVNALQEIFHPSSIIERSDLSVRREEKLEERVEILYGEDPGHVPFFENTIPFLADPLHGQKTGFFLDQKNLRQAIRALPLKNKNVLNLFSYSGGSSIAALLGGAKKVHNVDASETALALAEKNAKLNNINMTYEAADIFQWLNDHNEPTYDLVIMDPPALIKAAKETEQGKKAYHFLNRAAMRLVKDGGLFITSSCSHFLSEDDLAFTLRRASVQAGIQLDILQIIHQSPDHPRSIYFPESAYLQSFICQVKRTTNSNP